MINLDLSRILRPWTLDGNSGGGLGVVRCNLFASNTFDINSGDTWSIIVGSAFEAVGLDSRFSLTEDSCLITYNGAPISNVLFSMIVSIEAQGGAVSGTSGAALDYNGDLVGTAMQSNASAVAGAQEQDLVTGGALCIPTSRLIPTLSPGDVIRPVMAKFNNIADFVMSGMYLTISN